MPNNPFDGIGRDLTRDEWRRFYRILRKHGRRGRIGDWSTLGERAYLQQILDDCTEQGEVGLVESGMDCDCVQYCYGKAHPAMPAIAFQRRRADVYDWADGPCRLSICRPSELPESYQRDLVMEAYENGHPHSIHA